MISTTTIPALAIPVLRSMDATGGKLGSVVPYVCGIMAYQTVKTVIQWIFRRNNNDYPFLLHYDDRQHSPLEEVR